MPHTLALPAADAVADRAAPMYPPEHAPPPGVTRAWADRVSHWLRAASESLEAAGRRERVVDDFADLLSRARDLGEVRAALVELAARASGAARAELFRARAGRGTRPLASWPAPGAGAAPGSSWAEHRDKPGQRTRRDRPEDAAIKFDLRSAGEVVATLHLTPEDGRPWPSRAARAVETLCSMAASAERGLGDAGRGFGREDEGQDETIRGEPALDAFLQFALAQARRRCEPVSLLAIAVDRLGAIRSLLGDDFADEAVARVARSVQEALRASDVVVRLDGGRLMAILPTASADDSARVAETVRAAIARAGEATEAMPTLTATLGVASYPDHAGDVAGLRAGASSALTSARGRGNDRVGVHAPASAFAS